MVLLDMDRECRTALHCAAQAGAKQAVELLLKALATERIEEDTALPAFFLAHVSGQRRCGSARPLWPICRVLCQRGAK